MTTTTTTSSVESSLLKNIEMMNRLEGFNVVIVCCSSDKQANYWQQRLERGRGSVLPAQALVLAVEEDWPGGAGNALGTLYAFVKASRLAQERFGLNLLEELKASKISVGLYHTAGKGTRLAPLPGSENNNKPGVKLPSTVLIEGKAVPITILEAVIKQTGCYASSRLGRLSVFWGDQVFIPTAPVTYTVNRHADILCSLGPMMTEKEWHERGMEKYGLIAQCEGGSTAQVEKVSHATAVQLLSSLGEIHSVGVSLGSFSISWQLLEAFLDEFASELSHKTGKLDSDPHLWMPITLGKTAYLQIMKQKGVSEEKSSAHYERIRKLLVAFHERHGTEDKDMFGAVDVGQGVLWWDYGQLKLYQQNTLLLTHQTSEAAMLRSFYSIPEDRLVRDSSTSGTDIDAHSCVSSSLLGGSGERGFVKNSVISNVRCKYIEAEDCVLINVTAERIVAKKGSIAYNLVHEGELQLGEKAVEVGVFDETGKQLVVKSTIDIDGGKAWETRVEGNEKSFEEIYDSNANACPLTLEKVIASAHDAAWQKM
eukprot:gene8779-9681_t